MSRPALIIAVAAAGLACVKDRSCRDNTVLVNVDFADSRDLVDGVALKVRLDDAPAVDLLPIERPPGVDRDRLELAVQNYASHKKLSLQYAPRKGENVVGPWQEEVVEIKPGCTTIDLIVAIGGGDAGLADALALLGIDARQDGTVVATGVDGVSPRDVEPDVLVAMPEVGVVDALAQPDMPVAPESDAPPENTAPVDLPVAVVVVDAPLAQNLPSGAASDATLDASPEVPAGLRQDVAPDGPTDTGQVGCFIDSTPYAAGAANPANACQTCQPTLSASTWTNASNGTACGSGQVCSVGICRLGCWLDGSFFPAAATKPGNTCQYCNPTLSAGAWSTENDGTSCGNGQMCNAGLCGTGCRVSGTFYTSGAANPANACQTCQPGTSDTAWTNSANGTSCGPGQVCSSAGCQSGCWIDRTLYSSGAAKPGNPCQTCQPGVSVTAWTNAASTTACPAGQVCNAGACQPGCSIGGTYYATDAANPSNACQACKPGVARALWTDLADGTGCGTGKICSAASCQAGCWIDSIFRATAATKSDNACQSCQPSVSGAAWTNVGDGTSCGNQQGCSGGACVQVGCFIDSTPFAAGAANPANACQTCQPALLGSSWTNVSNGTGCGSGQVCNAGICCIGCWVYGAYYAAAATKPDNACRSCKPTLSASAWSTENDGTSCGNGQVCNAGLCGTGCWISSTFHASGAANPANPCQTCQPGTSNTAWSGIANGASCGAGQVCSSETCQSGCWIESTLYSSGAAKPGNPCQTCQPGVSVTAWTSAVSTTACPAGQACSAGACQPGCSIGGTYYATDALNPGNACQACKPGTSVALWTDFADGTGCGTGKVCSAASCQAGCWIDSSFRAAAAAKPDNACQSCQPTVSGTAWTNVGNGTSCGNQQECSGGVCVQVGCVIDSTPYAAGAANPANACQTCQPALSGSTWTNASNGTGCGSGQVCSVGICRFGCWQDGAYYPVAATKPGNACQYCNPTLSTAAWTSENDGTSCGSGQVCNAGLCGTGCWISSTLYTSGAVNPANACQTCQPGSSASAWTNSGNGASCGAGQVCSSTTCQSGCWIDSTLYSSGAAKPGNPCQTCQPGTSVTAWTNTASTTACPTGQVCTAGACQPGCSIGGTYYATDAANPSNACQVCKPGTSTTGWTNVTDGTGCGSGKVCSAASCQAGCWIDSTFRATGATKPDNACQSCQPGASGTAWTNVGDGTSCGNQQGCSAGVCGSGCWINSVFYTSGTAKSDNPCQSCQPGTSTTAWTNVADSTGCGSGQVCYLGTCGDCVPGTPRCKNASTRQICQANRTWLDDTPACIFGCNSRAGSCYPDCTPDALGCSTNAEPKQCDASGHWQVVGAACTYGCNSGSGTCYPQCTPNALGCSTSTQPRQCDASGMWQNLTACIAGKEECVGAGNCLKVDGRACAVPGQCASGVCTTFYVDADGDGYTINPASFCGTSPPSGYVSSSLGTDCCDSDANAHPGQTVYFTTTRIGCGGYDYNCAGGDEQQYTATFNVNFTSLIVCGAGPAGGAWSAVTVPPACGASGSWMLLTDCFCMAGMSGPQRCPYSGCIPSTCYQGCAGFTCGSSRTQACR